MNEIKLTQTVKKGGCAAKVAAVELRKILKQVKFPANPKELLIDSSNFDDAAVYRVNDDLALVQTLDFFTPIVNSPKQFGRIAAANALSDVYAMGGRPVTAMAIFAFPLGSFDNQVAVEVLQGASDVIGQSGASLVGGHTIDDDTMKFGLSVTGFVDPKRVWSNAGAKEGDILILTKALGTGTLTAALKRDEATEDDIHDGLESMAQLNDIARDLSPQLLTAIHAATDVTGFGLAGHALNMALASQKCLEIDCEKLPRFNKTMEFLEKGILTKAHRTNSEYIQEQAEFVNTSTLLKQLVVDPQTSGGLLLSVTADQADELLTRLRERFGLARKIGRVTSAQRAVALRFL
jgi:selenide,water dikinase